MSALVLWLLLAKGGACEDRCAAVAKPCVEHCGKTFIKEEFAGCKKACEATVVSCKERCKNDGAKK
jgi:hypothetical protein